MSLRRRITLVSAAAVAIAVLLASVVTYVLVSDQLHKQVNTQLGVRAADTRRLLLAAATRAQLDREVTNAAAQGSAFRNELTRLYGAKTARRLLRASSPQSGTSGASAASGSATTSNPFSGVPPRPNQVRGYQQLIDSHGKVRFSSPEGTRLPVNAATLDLAEHGGQRLFYDTTVKGVHVRVLAEPVAPGYAAMFAQPLDAVDSLLARLRLILLLLDIGGVALAALLGRLVAGAALGPVRRLTEASERVTRTRDLSLRIAPETDDEIGRLAFSFNAMLDALESSMRALDASVHAQRQLVADASHELRTPITSIRTNIEILQQVRDMDEHSRTRLLDDVVEQIEELTLLITDLIDLARGEQPREQFEEVRFDLLVAESVGRTRRHAPDARFDVDLEETLVMASPGRLDRAVNNLLDNAVKYSPRAAWVQVTLHGGELSVRDHGPGIPEDDLPHVFDRFYRGAEARGRSGSGLGLAIVRQVAETHDGTVTAVNAPDGGALLRLALRPLDVGTEAEEPAVLDPSPARV